VAKYEVVAGIYKSGVDESLEEETLLETDDLTEAQEFLAELAEGDDSEDAGELVEEEDLEESS